MSKRLEYVRGIFDNVTEEMVTKKLIISKQLKTGEQCLSHPIFDKFIKNSNPTTRVNENSVTTLDDLFNYLVKHDPTPRHKYVQWYVGLFKIYADTTDINEKVNVDETYRFFEDLPKLSAYLERYTSLKTTNVLTLDQKQINQYDDYKDVIDLVQPYMSEEGDDNVHTLDHNEIQSIQDKNETVVFAETKDHIVVITKTKESNQIFGKFTTWCTAGTRYGDMFTSHHKQGPLFVVIRKGKGSKKSIGENPSNRIQMHFETNQYMDANDRPIDVAELLIEDPELKIAFKGYISGKYLKNRTIDENVITFLLKLGYADVMIDMIVESQPKALNLSGNKIKLDQLGSLGKIKSLEILDFSDTNIEEIPESLRELPNLKELYAKNNPKLKVIPKWINELTTLEVLNFVSCDIDGDFSVSNLVNLRFIGLDHNRRLEALPTGIENCVNLTRLNVAYCNLKYFNMNNIFTKLEVIDIHENKELTSFDFDIVGNAPKLHILCSAFTGLSDEKLKELENTKHGNKKFRIVNYSGA